MPKGFADSSCEEQCHKVAPKSKALPHCNSKRQTFVGSREDTRVWPLMQDFSPNILYQSVSPVHSLVSHLWNKIQISNFPRKKRKIMSHKALCRQQRSECLLFLHSKKDTTEKTLQSACQHVKFHFSALKKKPRKTPEKQIHTTTTTKKGKFCFHASGLSRNIY